MARKLNVFISSTADLTAHRDAVESTLEGLDIDGCRFETWPPAPNLDGGLAECLRRVDEADAVILLLGAKYGTIVDCGLSATHQEYRHAISKRKPVFPFILHAPNREEAQIRFVEEVQGLQFRGQVVGTISELKRTVRDALLQEYTRCFRSTHGGPPPVATPGRAVAATSPPKPLSLSDEPLAALSTVSALYNSGDDVAIQRLAPQIALKFGDTPRIANLMYMAEVNLGMRGQAVDAARINEAIEFWDKPGLRELATADTLAYCQGNALGVLERHQEAVTRFQFALSKNPKFARCWKNLGTAFVAVGDLAAAKQSFLKAVEIEPHLFEARYSLATLAIGAEDFQDALIHLDQIVIQQLLQDQQSWVHGYMAKSQSFLGRHAEAIGSAEAAIACAPQAEWVWYWAARVFAVARRADERWLPPSREFGERMVCRFPDSGEAWGELGYIYWQLQAARPDAQLSRRSAYAFSKAIDLGFTDKGLVADRLGHLYMDAGDVVNAESAFRKAVAEDAASYGYCLGCSLLGMERFQDALEWLTASAEKHHMDALAWGNLGFCYDKLGDRKNSIRAYERATNCGPDYAPAWFNLGGMLWNDGQRSRASELWREAIRRFPNHELASNAMRLLRIAE